MPPSARRYLLFIVSGGWGGGARCQPPSTCWTKTPLIWCNPGITAGRVRKVICFLKGQVIFLGGWGKIEGCAVISSSSIIHGKSFPPLPFPPPRRRLTSSLFFFFAYCCLAGTFNWLENILPVKLQGFFSGGLNESGLPLALPSASGLARQPAGGPIRAAIKAP